MLTTSRKEVFSESNNTFARKTPTVFDTKILGRDSYVMDSDTKKQSNSVFGTSYFADSKKEIAAKLFGSDVVVEELTKIDIDESDTENFTNPDLMPTGITMDSRSDAKVVTKSPVAERETKTFINIQRLSQKGKVAVVAYVAVVLALVLVIALTSVAINASLGNIANVQAEINMTIEDINAMYADVEQNAELYAQELGLVSATEATTAYYNPLSTREEITYEISENWFDNLCEWVSNIFGG